MSESTERTVTVTIALRGAVADRLKAMCYARGQTASTLIDRWVFEHDARGDLPVVNEPKRYTPAEWWEQFQKRYAP